MTVLWSNHGRRIPYSNKLLLVKSVKILELLRWEYWDVTNPRGWAPFSSLRVHTCYCWGDWHSPLTSLLLNLKLSRFLKEKNGWCQKRKMHIGFQHLSNLRNNYYNLINNDLMFDHFIVSLYWYEILRNDSISIV